jgi:uncharacterized membrane protein
MEETEDRTPGKTNVEPGTWNFNMNNTRDIVERAQRDVAQRRQQQSAHKQQNMWLWAFVVLSVGVLGALLFWPAGTLAGRLQLAVQGVCAQQHYVMFGNYRLPLCARNTGIYAGFLATLCYIIASGRSRAAKLPPWSIVGALAAAVVVMGIDGMNSMLLDFGGYNLYTPQNELRVATGLGMGSALAVFGVLVFNISLRWNARHDQAVVANWLQLGGAVVAGMLIYLLVWWAPQWLYYPLALFSVAGIVGVLFASNMFVVAMIGGYEGRVTLLRQLARPATIGLVLVVAELALLAWFRYLMEQSLRIV